MESFMEVIKRGKIAVLKSDPGHGMVTFVRDHIKKDYPDVYHVFITGSGYVDPFDVKLSINEEYTEILAIVCDNCEPELFEYLESLRDRIAIILMVHDVPERLNNEGIYVHYEMNTFEQKNMAYYGDKPVGKVE